MKGSIANHARKILNPLRDLFVVIFFLFFGLQINTSNLIAGLGMTAGMETQSVNLGVNDSSMFHQ